MLLLVLSVDVVVVIVGGGVSVVGVVVEFYWSLFWKGILSKKAAIIQHIVLLLCLGLFIQAGIKKWGTDESSFIEIFTTRSVEQLHVMLDEYTKVT